MSQTATFEELGAKDHSRSWPERFNDWQLIGSGGSADVFRVFDTELGVPLAVKILKKDHRNDPRYVASLRREVLISRRLRHPNICPIHDLYESDRGVGIVMDLIDGHDLKHWLKANRGRLLETIADRVGLLRKLTDALVVAHSLITHRDLKPANIFLLKDDIVAPMIMDFGLSTAGTADSVLEGGTPKYMAPEQFLRFKDIDRRADLFALGILAYEVLTDGQIPACSLKDVQKTGALPTFDPAEIPPPSAFCAAIPTVLDRLVLQLMAHDRERRPDFAAEVVAVLAKVTLLDPFRPFRSSAETPTVKIAAGAYVVGEKSGRTCDQPQRKIRLSSYAIATSPVTNLDYRLFLKATGHRAPTFLDHPVFGADPHPVVMVTWDDARAYAKWAGGRLPTELEWEVAARAGMAENCYPWGGDPPKIMHANIDNVCRTTTPVASYPTGSNAYGLGDCCGNVWEWCADVWDAELLKNLTGETIDSRRDAIGPFHAIRGGSFDSPARTGRTSYRHKAAPTLARADIGFRLAFGA